MEDSAGAAIAELIGEQLQAEAKRKESFEARGFSVITTSGVLVSLLLGLAALVTKSNGFTLTAPARNMLVGALGLFVLAAVAGIVANLPLRYSGVAPGMFTALLTPERWVAGLVPTAFRTAEARVKILARARDQNAIKGRAVTFALLLEVCAVTYVAGSVALILLKPSANLRDTVSTVLLWGGAAIGALGLLLIRQHNWPGQSPKGTGLRPILPTPSHLGACLIGAGALLILAGTLVD